MDPRSLAQLLLAKQYTNFEAGDLFIELGPGDGGAFDVAEEILLSPKIIGIELNEGAKEAFKRVYGVEIFTSIKDVIAKGYRGKICLLSHSLEHLKLSWLKDSIKDFKQIISPGGVLIVEVPLVDMRIHADYGCGSAPHFLFFSADSLRLIFEEHGWDILFINSCDTLYMDWMKSKGLLQKGKLSKGIILRTRVKNLLRKLIAILPALLQKKILTLVTRNRLDFSNMQFSYGGDRTCLRIVVQPKIATLKSK